MLPLLIPKGDSARRESSRQVVRARLGWQTVIDDFAECKLVSLPSKLEPRVD